jgi:hypothetical protein
LTVRQRYITLALIERQVHTMRRTDVITVMVLLGLVCLAAVPLFADIDYVVTNNGSFVQYNTTTGAYSLLGTSSAVLYGLGYSSGVLYANDSGASPATGFYTVNPTNGALTAVGNLTGSTNGTGALTAPIGGGTIYYFDHSNQLFSINPGTGAATTIGPLGFTVAGNWDINFAPNGNLYVTSNGDFGQIDPTTGATTYIGHSGVQMQGMIPGDGTLYGFSGTSMYSIDLTTGAVTFVRNTPSALGNFESGTPVVSSGTPEPGTLMLLGSGALVAISRFRRRFGG